MKSLPYNLIKYTEHLETAVKWLKDRLETAQGKSMPIEEILRDMRAL